jgi:hypothetical protein
MGELKRGERLQIMLTDDELSALDDWRFAARMPSRAAAIRELLKRGLAAEGISAQQARARSGDYGVLEAETDGQRESSQQPRSEPEGRQPDGHDNGT